jgi:senataxin
MFSKIFDERDIYRITKGLKVAERQLLGLPPEKRGKDSVEKSALLAIFEALSCEEFLADDKLVRQHLEEPFKLLQTNVRLQVTHFVPAATVFLFDADQSRCYWAMHTWSKYRSQLTKDDFNFAVRGPLSHVLALASEAAIDMNFVQRLWCGIRLIVDKLDSSLITHSLRAMEIDVCRLALEHLKYETAGLRFLMQTIEKLLSKASKDFWDAMGAISPTTFIEQVFNNPQYDRFMVDADKDENYEFSALKDMLFWVQPFMASLLASHQPQACRSLAFQLLGRLQADRFPEYTRLECYRVGLGVLIWTLSNCSKDRNTFDTVGRVAAAETLNVTSIYIKDVITIPRLPSESEKHKVLTEPCLRVITTALMLECKSLRSDQEALQSEALLPHGYSSFSLDIWQTVVRSLDRGNVVLAKAALAGITDLAGLEKFIVKEQAKNAKEKADFNMIFGQLTHWVCAMLERINDFTPQDLDKLFRAPETAIALVSSLFSADASTYEAGVNLIKTISGEIARKEAISHLLLPFFETTLNSFSWSVRRIAHKRTFASCPRMLKTCTDVLDILTDAQDGLLRLRPLFGVAEIKAVENFWEHMWEALRVIYEMTEEWSRRISDSVVMKNFCRDIMQFSDHLFDQYSIFSSAVDSASSVKQEASESQPNGDGHIARRDLLKHPSGTMEAMVRWLRLRDEYLVSTFEALITKVLHRLSEWKLTLPEGATIFLEQVIAAQARTILTPQQKAGLARALEANLGRPVTAAVVDVDHSDTSRSHSAHSNTRDCRPQLASNERRKLKSGTIDLESWAAKAKRGREIIDVSDDDDFGDSDLLDEDILAASSSVERFKQLQIVKSSGTKHVPSSSSGFPATGQKRTQALKTESQQQAAHLAFREKREKDIQAKKKRDAEALAKAKKNLPQHGSAIKILGEGSNVGNLGVLGKDHAPKGSGMMVSSGSDTDSDDELDHELFGKSNKAPKVSTAVQEYNSSRTQQAKAQLPVKKTRQVRTAKDMRARLAPDLSALHKTILSWDFFHNGDFPPNTDRDNYSLVTNTFRNPLEYQTTFEPLLVLEAWQAFLKSKEEGYFKSFEIRVANRLTVDAFVEVSTTMDMTDGKALGISEADIILMSKASSPASESSQPHCLARVFRITRKQKAMEISYRVNVGNNLMSSIVPNANLHGVKISSITPLEREYGALLGLKYYDLCDEIVKARASPLLQYSEKQVESIISIYKLNSAQAKAVKSAIDNDAFTLIQG